MCKYLIKRKIKKEFLKEHERYLPKYSPQGQPICWRIDVYWDGEYDIMSGKPINGNYKVAVNQKPPRCTCDDNVYIYNIKEKKLEIQNGVRWW